MFKKYDLFSTEANLHQKLRYNRVGSKQILKGGRYFLQTIMTARGMADRPSLKPDLFDWYILACQSHNAFVIGE